MRPIILLAVLAIAGCQITENTAATPAISAGCRSVSADDPQAWANCMSVHKPAKRYPGYAMETTIDNYKDR